MSFDIIFVHGTGVRQPDYSKSFSAISEQLKKRDSSLRVHECYWGGIHGTTLRAAGASIPPFDTRRAVNADLSDTEFELGLWELLYQDPLLELQILHLHSGKEALPGGKPPGYKLKEDVKTLAPSVELCRLLEEGRIEEVFDEAREQITSDHDYQKAVKSAQQPFGDYRTAIARALVAQSVILAQDEYNDPILFLSAELRDQIVQQLVNELGGTERGMLDGPKAILMGMVKRPATNMLKHGRIGFTVKISGPVGDILMYQTRGQSIRNFIREEIGKHPGPIVLLGHSLGGIACVDLLLEPNPPKVVLLVTIGSQAPLLYEMNALVGMPYDPNSTLPSTFPQWLNIYDKDDLLSYVGSNIFPEKVEDFHAGSGKPFPDSHSAYWKDSNVKNEVWDKIVKTLKNIKVV